MTEQPASPRPADPGRRRTGLAIAACLLGVTAYVAALLAGADHPLLPLVVVLPLVLLAIVLVSRATEAERGRRAAEAPTERQAALCRVAILVATGADSGDVYAATVAEVARVTDADHVTLVGFDSASEGTVLAARGGEAKAIVGERFSLTIDSLAGRIRRTGEAVRDTGTDPGVGVPFTVDGVTRGALVVRAVGRELPGDVESWLSEVADLVATAIANAETRAGLAGARTRILAATDRARRDLQHDLRDGAQQRIAALGLGLRAIEASVSPDDQAVRLQLDNVITGLADLYRDVQELARGIHPAGLAKGGLASAINALARRSALPAGVEVDVDRRLPEPTEIAAYYVVAEALTDAAKHSRASGVRIRAHLGADELHVEVTDDGVDDASSAAEGSGFVDLRDRVAAVSGRLTVTRSPEGGTTVTARFPHVTLDGPS